MVRPETVLDAQFAHDVFAVGVYGMRADVERRGYFFGRIAIDQ